MSRIPEAIDRLQTIWVAGLPSDVVVSDGPELDGRHAWRTVFVGYNGDPEGDWVAAESDQQWHGLGAGTRLEKFTIVCSLSCLNGAGDAKAARDDAFLLFEDAAQIVHDDPSLGLPLPTTAQVRSPQFGYGGIQGIEARIAFGVHVETRI